MTPFKFASVILALARERADLLERTRIDQPADALADREAATVVMLGDGFGTAERIRLAAAEVELLDLGSPAFALGGCCWPGF